LIVTESGIYTIEATYIGSFCAITDSVQIEIYPLFINDFEKPELIKVCSNSDRLVDLTYNEAIMLNGIPSVNFVFDYYPTLTDLENNTNVITNPYSYLVNATQNIYVKITNIKSGCTEQLSFTLMFIDLLDPVVIKNDKVCTSYFLPSLPEGQKYFTGPGGTGDNLKENTYIGVGKHKIYVRSENDICFDEVSFEIEVVSCEVQKGISPNGDGLNDFLDLSIFNALSVKIFNRYGTEVYSHGIGYTNQWHGQNKKGDALPSGTYFYTILTPFETFTGWIQLTREVN